MRKIYSLIWAMLLVLILTNCHTDDGIENLSSTNLVLIDDENLNDWDFGLTNGKQFIVYKTNTDGTTTACVSNYSYSKFSFILDIENNTNKVVGFGTSEKYYPIKESDDEYLLYQWLDDNLEFFSVPKQNISEQSVRSNLQSRNLMGVGSFIVTSYIALKNLYKLGVDLHEGRWGDFLEDLGLVATDSAKGNLSGGPFVALTNERVKQLKAEIDNHNIKHLYGDATIRITGINQQNDGTYLVHTEIDGISSIRDKIEILVSTETFKNHVYAGVLCRESYPAFINYYTYKSNEAQISDGSTSTKKMSFSLPKLDKGQYYIRPYLRSSINNIISSTGNSYIKYGEQQEVQIIGGRINKFEQNDARSFGGSYVTFVAYANVEIDSNDGLEDWGIYYIEDGIYKYFSASFPTAKINEDIRIEMTVLKDDFDQFNSESFIASKAIKLGVFKKRKNPTGLYDYQYYDYGEMGEYQLIYDQKPSMVFTSASVDNTEILAQDEHGKVYQSSFNYTYTIKGSLWFDSVELEVSDNMQERLGDIIKYKNSDGTYSHGFTTKYEDYMNMFTVSLVGYLSAGGRYDSETSLLYEGSPINKVTILYEMEVE